MAIRRSKGQSDVVNPGRLFIGGRWVGGGEPLEVRNKYSGEIVGVLPTARAEDVDAAIGAAARAAETMAELPAYRRSEILALAAAGVRRRAEEIARTIAAEAGKPLKYARAEVQRASNTFAVAAEEAKRIHGETVPLDAAPAGASYFGFYLRRPVGIVAAITPFNFPLNLVAHKVAPAIAAGNSLVLKPASATPLTALALCEILEEAGLPEGGINLIVGPGSTTGQLLVGDGRVSMVTFTGSEPVGRMILAQAGIKKVTLELGNTTPVVLAPDADLEFAAKRCAVSAYYNSGQVCISAQRLYACQPIYESFLPLFVRAAETMVVGDPLDERVDVGPMIDEREAVRIEGWVDEARRENAEVLTGGKRAGAVYWPTVLANVRPEMRVVSQETFAPVASVISCDSYEQALEAAGATCYGLHAAVFTRRLDRLFQALRRLNFGGVIVNDAPNFRVDHMPYGGNRASGVGREGVRYAMEEMTNIQMVAIRTEEMAI